MADMSFKLFDLVVRTGSLSKAAVIANLSPSAVSHSLKKLESNLGVQLITRKRDGVRLTDAGRQLLPYIRAAVSAEDKLDDAIFQVANIKRTELSVGVFSSVGISWIPEILIRMKAQYPEINIRLVEGYYSDLEESLSENLLDVAFLSLPVSDKLQSISLYQDRLLCIVPAEFAPENEGYITIAELGRQTIIMQGKGNTVDTRRFLSEYGLAYDESHAVWDDTMLVRMVEAGLGVAIVPELVLDHVDGTYRALPIEGAPYRTIGLVTGMGPHIKKTARPFAELVTDYVAERYPEDLPYFR